MHRTKAPFVRDSECPLSEFFRGDSCQLSRRPYVNFSAGKTSQKVLPASRPSKSNAAPLHICDFLLESSSRGGEPLPCA